MISLDTCYLILFIILFFFKKNQIQRQVISITQGHFKKKK